MLGPVKLWADAAAPNGPAGLVAQPAPTTAAAAPAEPRTLEVAADEIDRFFSVLHNNWVGVEKVPPVAMDRIGSDRHLPISLAIAQALALRFVKEPVDGEAFRGIVASQLDFEHELAKVLAAKTERLADSVKELIEDRAKTAALGDRIEQALLVDLRPAAAQRVVAMAALIETLTTDALREARLKRRAAVLDYLKHNPELAKVVLAAAPSAEAQAARTQMRARLSAYAAGPRRTVEELAEELSRFAGAAAWNHGRVRLTPVLVDRLVGRRDMPAALSLGLLVALARPDEAAEAEALQRWVTEAAARELQEAKALLLDGEAIARLVRAMERARSEQVDVGDKMEAALLRELSPAVGRAAAATAVLVERAGTPELTAARAARRTAILEYLKNNPEAAANAQAMTPTEEGRKIREDSVRRLADALRDVLK